jgi:hypothetical protein
VNGLWHPESHGFALGMNSHGQLDVGQLIVEQWGSTWIQQRKSHPETVVIVVALEDPRQAFEVAELG